MDIEQAFETTVGINVERDKPTLGARVAEWLRAAVRWAWQVEVALATDVAGVVLESRRCGAALLPWLVCFEAAGDELRIRVERAAADGSITVSVAQYTITLGPGDGADYALVPALDGRSPEVVAEHWQELIEQRLASGQPTGRLSIVNHGFAPKRAP